MFKDKFESMQTCCVWFVYPKYNTMIKLWESV